MPAAPVSALARTSHPSHIKHRAHEPAQPLHCHSPPETKGTGARRQVAWGFEGGQVPLHMRLPKLRGFKNPAKVEFQVVNLDWLSAHFPEGGEVDIDDLVAHGGVRSNRPVKVLGSGEIGVALQITADAFSSSAREKIEAAGGSATTR